MRGMQDACGRSVHIIPSPDRSANQRPACRRPSSSDHLKRRWQHIGTGPYWESMTEWVAATVGVWPHNRDLINEPLQRNECIYSRQDCVSGLHSTFVRKQYQSLTGGSAAVMQIWQKSLGERYPSLTHHVKHKLAHVDLRGGYILDSCGSEVDAVHRVLTDKGLQLLTNDMNGRMTQDTHLDVLLSEVLDEFAQGHRQPQ